MKIRWSTHLLQSCLGSKFASSRQLMAVFRLAIPLVVFFIGAICLSQFSQQLQHLGRSDWSDPFVLPNSSKTYRRNTSFVAYGDDSKELPLCNREQVKYGHWSPVTLDKPPYIPSDDFGQRSACYDDSMFLYNSTNGFPSYDWHPSDKSCSFVPWNRNRFCEVVSNRTIAFVGDSISYESFTSLVGLLGGQITSRPYQNRKGPIVWKAPCGATIAFKKTHSLDDSHLEQIFRRTPPDILIINRGAHYVEDEQLRSEFYATLNTVSKWQTECQRRSHDCRFIFRTSPPGHSGCGENFTKPFESLEEMEAHVSNPLTETERERGFHWDEFGNQNELMLDLIRKHLSDLGRISSYSVMDAYHTLGLRIDLHRAAVNNDCLHSCYPGKMDFMNQLLLHTLLAPPHFVLAAEQPNVTSTPKEKNHV